MSKLFYFSNNTNSGKMEDRSFGILKGDFNLLNGRLEGQVIYQDRLEIPSGIVNVSLFPDMVAEIEYESQISSIMNMKIYYGRGYSAERADVIKQETNKIISVFKDLKNAKE